MRRTSFLSRLALESGALTMTTDPASPFFNVAMPASGAAVDVSAVKLNILGQLEQAPLAQQPKVCKHCGLACEAFLDLEKLPLENAATVADQLMMAKTQSELDADQARIDEATDVIFALEELAAALPATGLLDAPTGRALSIATESLCARVGLEAEGSFTLDPGAAVKWIKDTSVKIWKAIIAALQRAWKHLKNFIMRLMDMSGRVEKRAQELISKIKHGVGQPSELTFVAPRLYHALQAGGKFPTHLGEQAAQTVHLVSTYLEKGITSALFDVDLYRHLSDDKAEFHYSPADQKRNSFLKYYGSAIKFTSPGRPDHDSTLWHSVVLLGDLVIEQSLPTDGAERHGYEAIHWMLSTPHLADGEHRGSGGEEVPVLDTNQLLGAAQAAQKLAACVKEFRSHLTGMQELAEKLTKAAQSSLVDLQKSGEPTGMQVLKLEAQRRYLSQAPRWLVAEPVAFANYGVATANALVSYVDKCLTHYTMQPAAKAA